MSEPRLPLEPASDAVAVGMNARLFPGNWRPLPQEAAFAAEVGFRCLQVVGYDVAIDERRLGQPLADVPATLRRAGLDAVVEVVGRLDPEGRTPAGLTPLEALRVNLPAIRALGARRVHLHLAPALELDDQAASRLEALVLDDVAAGVALGEAEGFRLGLEHNEPRLRMFASPARMWSALDAVPGLGFVWDLNHTAPDELDAFLSFVPRLTLVHVSDAPVPELNAHYPLGQGTLDVERYLQGLLEVGWAGPAVLEIGGHPRFGGFGRDTDAALADSYRRLRAALGR